jgi:hypothetical protein
MSAVSISLTTLVLSVNACYRTRSWKFAENRCKLLTVKPPNLKRILAVSFFAAALGLTPSVEAQTGIKEYRVTNASRSYDFVVRIQEHSWQGTDEYREGPGEVVIVRKGVSKPFQTIVMENIFVSRDKHGQPLVNTATLYDDQGMINVGDFNFDGHEDFAVQNGNHGSYGGPSYSVYLYSPKTTAFVYSKALSSLIEDTLGFFRVDGKNKHLITLSKSGCCYHETVVYAVKEDVPVPVSRVVEDATTAPDGFEDVRHEKYVNGKWKGNKKRIALSPENRK